MKVKEVIVVEGRDDSIKVQQAVDADTIETNGSAINKDIIKQIKHAKEKRGVIVFTDPDFPGKRIRSIIDQHVPGCKHAFLTKKEATSKHSKTKNLGIEHASIQTIQLALKDVYELMDEKKVMIERKDLIAYNLVGGEGSKERRKKLGQILRIGETNAKQLLKRLTMFHITKEQFEAAMRKVLEEENDGK